ncbi:MAG: hypothetical protein ACXWQO_17235 [Bdellovibrionota bacterium]
MNRGLLFLYPIAAFLAPFSAYALSSYDYEWLVKDGVVVGCTETSNIELTDDPMCGTLPFTPLECIKYVEKEKIYDPALCATKIHTQFDWLDEVSNLCGEFAKVDRKGKTSKFFLRAAPKSLCGHTWLSSEGENGQCYFREAGQYLFHPLSGLNMEQLVPEIMNLAKNETVPIDVYEKYDSRLIGATLVYKIFRDQESQTAAKEKTKSSEKDFNYLENSELQIGFKMEDFDAIYENGFLNQHQLHKSFACLCPGKRSRVEDALAGRPLANGDTPPTPGQVEKINEVRPKYSYFSPVANKADMDHMNHTYRAIYGEVLAVLKPQVKDRATFTNQDSLDTYFKGADHPYRHTPRGAKKLLEGEDSWEAQIWGDLKIKDDVNYFLWDCFKGKTDTENPAGSLDKLKATGKPVYQCEKDEPTHAAINGVMGLFRRGKEL